MAADPISDNQTELMISRLSNRTDGDPLLNQAVAAMLLSLTKLIDEVANIKRSLLANETLERMIEEHHKRLCDKCQVKADVAALKASRTKPAKWWQAAFSKDGLLVIVVLLFALMCVYATIGREGYRTVTGTLRSGEVQR